MDTAVAADHAHHHATPQAGRPAGADSLSPHGRTVRILLRISAPDDVPLARQVFRLAGDPQGRRQAPVHHRRVPGVRPDAPAGGHLDCGVDPLAGRRALAPAPSTGLRERGCRSDSLLLAGEIRYPGTAVLCGDSSGVAGVPAGREAAWLDSRHQAPARDGTQWTFLKRSYFSRLSLRQRRTWTSSVRGCRS